jgi:hypothetical protein
LADSPASFTDHHKSPASAISQESKKHSIEIQLFGSKCRVISAEDLIKAKETLGREKDRAVARELQAILKKPSER